MSEVPDSLAHSHPSGATEPMEHDAADFFDSNPDISGAGVVSPNEMHTTATIETTTDGDSTSSSQVVIVKESNAKSVDCNVVRAPIHPKT